MSECGRYWRRFSRRSGGASRRGSSRRAARAILRGARCRTAPASRRLRSSSPSKNIFLFLFSSFLCEIKHRSPSAGVILPDADSRIEDVARAYRRGGAAALSVVIEQDFFGGDPAWLPRAKAASGLPVLMKDFVVDEVAARLRGRPRRRRRAPHRRGARRRRPRAPPRRRAGARARGPRRGARRGRGRGARAALGAEIVGRERARPRDVRGGPRRAWRASAALLPAGVDPRRRERDPDARRRRGARGGGLRRVPRRRDAPAVRGPGARAARRCAARTRRR